MSSTEIQSELESNEKYKLRGNIIFRQELKSLTPKCDAFGAILCNIFLIVFFLLFGIPILAFSANIIEYKKAYANANNW